MSKQEQPLAIATKAATTSSPVARASSLFVLVLQNTALALLLHASRTQANYSAATAVLLNELLKGSLSFVFAYRSLSGSIALGATPTSSKRSSFSERSQKELEAFGLHAIAEEKLVFIESASSRLQRLLGEIFSADCWKLGVPAVLYVIQNNLQFVAASNLDVATFQVTYQLKILTTAVFSVLLLKKSLTTSKWAALVLLTIGVAFVQLSQVSGSGAVDSSMDRLSGFAAVLSACVTSGLAGVYFEMVLKGSSASVWVRNVQLSFFSIVPALLPALRPLLNGGHVMDMFDGFGAWAWATVWCQVIGGLVTALVIKYSDNIVKGFATSLAIVLSCVASATFFPQESQITLSFLVGTAIVLGATYLYNSVSSTSTTASPLQRMPSPVLPIYSPLSSAPSSPEMDEKDYSMPPQSPVLVSTEYGLLPFVQAAAEGRKRHPRNFMPSF